MNPTRRGFMGLLAASPFAAKKTAKEIAAKYGVDKALPMPTAANVAMTQAGSPIGSAQSTYAKQSRNSFMRLLRGQLRDDDVLDIERTARYAADTERMPPSIEALRSVSAVHKQSMHLQRARHRAREDKALGHLREWIWQKEER